MRRQSVNGGWTLDATIDLPFSEVLDLARAALAEQGFGILTEIDVAATLKEKIGVDVPHQVILGACRPELAHRALQVEPAVATMLPCNVVVRAGHTGTTSVQVFDPELLTAVADNRELEAVAGDARTRLLAMLARLGEVD